MSKEILLTFRDYVFYTDNTYRCTTWHGESVSDWKIVGDTLKFCHRCDEGWKPWGSTNERIVLKRLNEAYEKYVGDKLEEELFGEK